MKKLLNVLLSLAIISSTVMMPVQITAESTTPTLNENFILSGDPDSIEGFTYSKQNIDPKASDEHITWKGRPARDWSLITGMKNFNYYSIDNVIECAAQNKDSSVLYKGNFGSQALSFVGIYDGLLYKDIADNEWANWRAIYKNMPFKIYVGSTDNDLKEIKPTHFRTSAWQEAVYLEYMVKELPSDAKVVKIVIPAWDNPKYADRKIGRIKITKDTGDFVTAYINPFNDFTADEACKIKLQKLYSDGKEITSLNEGNVSAKVVVANERSATINANLITALYKNNVLVDVKTKSQVISSYETAIFSTQDEPLNIKLQDGESIIDYDVKLWVLTDKGAIGTASSSDELATKEIKIDANKYAMNKISVISPTYTSEVSGDTKVELIARGFKTVEAKCWKQNDKDGFDSNIATVNLDENGIGSFVFPADEYPHGPVTIRLFASDGENNDIHNLQLYNIGGVSFKEGLKTAEVPEIAKDLKVKFEDDFDGPLSISRWDTSAKWSSHKPGFEDWSEVLFKDFEDENLSPFGQVDSYLRIRADSNKNSTGCLSTLHQDYKSGTVASIPAYYECKMIAPYATGTWPAIFTMTNNEGTNGRPTDEYDLIEAYGFDDNKKQELWAYNGFPTTYHIWNLDPPDPKQKTHIDLDMTKIRTGASWFTTFHTYGMYVGEKETIYYLDNVEYWRHPTWPTTLKDPMFFAFNLAVGGISGWKVDLSRYNGVVDMYVDYVRIYSK